MRAFVGRLPKPAKALALRLGKAVKTSWFAIPDPLDDLCRLAKKLAPTAVLDVGAHEGQTSLELARRLPDVRIHAFEPTPCSADVYRVRLARCPTATLHQIALDEAVGTADFYMNENSQTNSLLENDQDNIRFLRESTAHRGVLRVRVETLEHWAAQVQPEGSLFIKMDVQGSELRVLRGGSRVVRERTAVVYSEVSLAALYRGQADLFVLNQWLRDAGFELYQLYRTRSNAAGRALWADALWVSGAALARLEYGG